jgi:hypothetical protein
MAADAEGIMDRKEFLKGCATGLCACAVAGMPAIAAETPKPEDWRLPFVKRRFAKLLGSLGRHMDEPALSASIQELGEYCASESDERTKKFAGNPDGYAAEVAKYGTTVTHDDARRVYTLTYDPKGDCFCPFNSLAAKTPGVMCECSVGNTRHTWSTVLQQEVKVELKEAVLRGGKRCKFEIRILEA